MPLMSTVDLSDVDWIVRPTAARPGAERARREALAAASSKLIAFQSSPAGVGRQG